MEQQSLVFLPPSLPYTVVVLEGLEEKSSPTLSGGEELLLLLK